MHVIDIYRYPVKSMLGQRLEGCRLTADGLPGDRGWALKDETRGEITSAKRFAGLMDLSARFLAEPDADARSPAVEISTAGGEQFSSADPDVNERLSRLLDHPVSLWPVLPADADAHYRRAAPEPDADPEAGLREVFARTADEPLPELSAFPPILFSHTSPPGTYFDAYPLLIISRGALTELERRARDAGFESVFDVRRFRPNLVIETGSDGFVEDEWAGRELRIGNALVRIEMACPRCIMTTHGFRDVPRDPKVMRALVQQHGGNLGMYASVVEAGDVPAGADIELR